MKTVRMRRSAIQIDWYDTKKIDNSLVIRNDKYKLLNLILILLE